MNQPSHTQPSGTRGSKPPTFVGQPNERLPYDRYRGKLQVESSARSLASVR